MNKLKYFIKNYGFLYTVLSTTESIVVKLFNKNIRFLHRNRANRLISYLRNKYYYIFEKWENCKIEASAIDPKSNIFIFWWQGVDNAPILVKKCIESIKRNALLHEVVIIDKTNIFNYIDIDNRIIDKVNNKNVSIANFSDLVRTLLLYKYGGIWLDATIYLNDNIDKYMNNLYFFSVKRGVKEKNNICDGKWSAFCLAVPKKSPIMGFASELFNEYYIKEDYSAFYFLVDCVFESGYRYIDRIKNIIDELSVNNENVFLMNKYINFEYDSKLFCKETDMIINKLSYKKDLITHINGKLTNYGHIINER